MALLSAVLLASTYVLNPFGAQGLDPRARILGLAPFRVSSNSMAPALQPGQYVIARAGCYRRRPPARGDVVVYRPLHVDQPWIGRVIALEGETAEIVDGVLRIDDQPLAEPYVAPGNLRQRWSRRMPAQSIGAGQVLLFGDNRDNSDDGRVRGPLPAARVIGCLIGDFGPGPAAMQ